MKKLTVKKRGLGFSGKFDVSYGENVIYKIEAKKIDLGNNIIIHDMKDKEVLHLKQETRIGPHKYSILKDEKEIGIVEKIYFTQRYIVSGEVGDFFIEADDLVGDYKINKDGKTIGILEKEKSFTGKYTVDIFDESVERLLVGIAVIIDTI